MLSSVGAPEACALLRPVPRARAEAARDCAVDQVVRVAPVHLLVHLREGPIFSRAACGRASPNRVPGPCSWPLLGFGALATVAQVLLDRNGGVATVIATIVTPNRRMVLIMRNVTSNPAAQVTKLTAHHT